MSIFNRLQNAGRENNPIQIIFNKISLNPGPSTPPPPSNSKLKDEQLIQSHMHFYHPYSKPKHANIQAIERLATVQILSRTNLQFLEQAARTPCRKRAGKRLP